MTEKVTEEPLVMGKGRETILVVDDNDVICNLAKDVLESMGYKVLLADSGKSALNFLSGGNGGLPTIDLLITDVIMPGGMNGWELYKKIEEKIPHIKTVFSSGYMENPIVLNEIMENGKHFISKPFNPQELLKKVRDVLDGKVEVKREAVLFDASRVGL